MTTTAERDANEELYMVWYGVPFIQQINVLCVSVLNIYPRAVQARGYKRGANIQKDDDDDHSTSII